MDTQEESKTTEEEKFNEEFLKIAFPDWMRTSKESHSFRGFVIDKHTILENLLDLLITSHFFEKITSEKAEQFRNNVLAYMDFAKKTKVLLKLKLIDEEIKSLIYQINDFRIAQAHIKKDDPFRIPSKENWAKYQEISTKALSLLSSKIILSNSELCEKVKKIITQKMSKFK